MNWPVLPIGDVAAVQGGIQKQPKRAPRSNAYPFLRVANVTSTGLNLADVHSIELFDTEIDRYGLQRGDLLVVEGNGSPNQIGRAAVWDGSIADAVHQNHLIRVRPSTRLDPRFLGLMWNAPVVREELTKVSSSSSGLHTLSVAKVKRIHIPVPPLDLQRRTVDILEDHLSRLDAAAGYLEGAAKRAEILNTTLLEVALAGVKIEMRPLAEVLAMPLSNGRSVQTRNGGFPVLRLTALRGDRIDLGERKDGAWTSFEAERWLVQRGDFLISRGNGSLRLVGRGGLVDVDPDPVAYPDTLVRARPNIEVVEPDYLALVWNSRVVRRQIEGLARTTAGIFKVNQKDLGSIEIPVPELSVQSAIVDYVKGQRGAVSYLSGEISTTGIRLLSLKRSLLAAAFGGYLLGDHSVGVPAEQLALV
ncbi:restriction endonuclease subunit S [Nocardia salmonicida]|uniref:restriction endonuclease subunit S n=1 Tax=Nocardia salmonicida TaxID=53431 RepID=UPI0036BDD7F6